MCIFSRTVLDYDLFIFMCSGLTTSNYTELAELYQKYKDQGWFHFHEFMIKLELAEVVVESLHLYRVLRV